MNDLSFDNSATILNSIVKQAGGVVGLTPTNANEFTAVAQTALLSGYDNLLGAISQVLSETLFSTRPYTAKFSGIQHSSRSYGNHKRKLAVADSDFEDDQRLPLDDATSIDMYTIKKPTVLQTNIYGYKPLQKHVTIFRDQLNVAFNNAGEFGAFISMLMSTISDQMSQAEESISRGVITSFIAGKIASDSTNCIHLLTEYNTATGLALTATTVLQPANYKPFMQWCYSRIAKICAQMTERTNMFQFNITNYNGKDCTIMRHTPLSSQLLFLHSNLRFDSEALVLADTYHDNYLRLSPVETVNFWQSPQDPMAIDITATYIDNTGTIVDDSTSTQQDNIVGVIIDRETVGVTTMPASTWMHATPFNAAGGYHNIYWHKDIQTWNDFTEKGVVLLLD